MVQLVSVLTASSLLAPPTSHYDDIVDGGSSDPSAGPIDHNDQCPQGKSSSESRIPSNTVELRPRNGTATGVSTSNLIRHFFRSFDLPDLMEPRQQSESVRGPIVDMMIIIGALNQRGGSDCCRCGCICLGVLGSTVSRQCRLEFSILGLAGSEGIGHGSRRQNNETERGHDELKRRGARGSASD